METLGITVGEARTDEFSFIVVDEERTRIGEFVSFDTKDGIVVGMIKKLSSSSSVFDISLDDPELAMKISMIEGTKHTIMKGWASILGLLDEGGLRSLRTPPPQGLSIVKASEEVLSRIFKKDYSSVKIGNFITRDEPVYVDVNAIISRHLAVIAITGAGKSNTVGVILERITELGGCTLVIDMHSEYGELEGVNKIPLKINPVDLGAREIGLLANIDEERAYIQGMYLRRALDGAWNALNEQRIKKGEFFKFMVEHLKNLPFEDPGSARIDRSQKDAILHTAQKIEDMERRYSEIFDPYSKPMIERIRPGINILDLGEMDEELQDAIVSHTIKQILDARRRYVRGRSLGKNVLPLPILVVVEEAHILIPRERGTLSKYWIKKCAREGRKFGVGICLVSQRPKGLDVDVLSQMNNMVIMRLVEPQDQRHVQFASEVLTDDLVIHLPALGIGEALLIGPWVPFPVLIKVDKAERKIKGQDIDAVGEWKELSRPDLDELYTR